MRRFVFLPFASVLVAVVAAGLGLTVEARVVPVPLPKELHSSQFQVQVNGKPVEVAHAAASYYYVSIEATSAVKIAITASETGFWDRGVDIQPWRLGIRPMRNGQTIEFQLKDPAKLSISRPRDFLNYATMLYIFVTRPTPPLPKVLPAGFHVLGPGVHRQSLNPKSGETWYLAPGAVIFGSLNLWKVDNVKVLGHGVIVYDGPQNPQDDDGWMQKPDWHCIGALLAHHVEIHGVTCLVRSRTWSVQMKDSTGFLYDDLRVIGGNPGNANQDGMDWLGGGDTIVRDSFFRASDDVLAMQGNWDGYDHDELVAPGHDVSNILVERSVLSTSISNIVRAGWPQKSYNSRNFTLRDSDILHSGIGSCGLPFALFTFWGANGAKGDHSGFTFENLWLDDWYSLFQIEKDQPELHGFTFRNIWALGQPPLVASELKGRVKDVHIENVKYGQALVTSNSNLPDVVSDGAQAPIYAAGDKRVRAIFQISPAVVEPGTSIRFTASATTDPRARYTWLFGDGTTAHGRQVRHRYKDALGTDLAGENGAGRFRVLLNVEDKQGHQDWSEQSVAVVGQWHNATQEKAVLPGLDYQIYPGTWPELPQFKTETATLGGVTPNLADANPGGFSRFAVTYDGLIEVPKDGGYSFHLLSRDGARLFVDGQVLTETGAPFSEVCGSPENAERYATGTIGLRAGKHSIHIEALESVSPGSPRILWDGPGIGLTDVPKTAFTHANVAALRTAPDVPVRIAKPVATSTH